MIDTVQMSFLDILIVIKKSLDAGFTNSAIILTDLLITRLKEKEMANSALEQGALKAKMLTTMDVIICGLESVPTPKLGEVNWPALLEDARNVKRYIEEGRI